ncbi:MAG: ATP phosphoribosyltransferase regulatory subunit, partial [Candidatus Diapherotrites archaeon]|nr:ATP phosphoribosyltransferase regulatory subunit [Candidatus Diapherotrites archaeon]
MRDLLPAQAQKKQLIVDTCKRVFERYGFAPLETPVVEDFALLSAKGSAGEAIKEEIYYFKDKSDRELGLRFDLTVPLARVVAANPQLAKPFKRYQVGTVYRYDRPGAKRYREFTQADWDIVGATGTTADFEVIAVAVDVMRELGFKQGEFFVKLNSRQLLEEIALAYGVEKARVADCFRSIDKLDKIGEEGVRKELQEKVINTQILGQIKETRLEKIKVKNTAPLEELKKLLELLKQNGLELQVRSRDDDVQLGDFYVTMKE